MNKISTRQLLFFLACITPVGKIVILPALLSETAKNDLLFPFIASYLLQAAAVFCALLAAKKGLNFYELLAHTFGQIAAKILVTLYALFLLFAGLLPILEQKLFVQSVFYDTLPSLVAFAPYFLFAVYLMAKPLSSHGRVWDILAPLSVIGIAGIFVLSFGSADFAALLPVGAAGGKGFLEGTMSATAWFFDAALLLPLLGKFEYKKGLAWKGTLCYLAGGAAAAFFVAMFYAIFQEIAPNQLFAFTATSKYFSGITMLGRIDYLFIFALALVMAFYVTLPLEAGIECVLEAYGRPRYLHTGLAVAVTAVFLLITALLDYRFTEVLDAVTKTAFWIIPAFSLAAPPLLLPLRRKQHADR